MNGRFDAAYHEELQGRVRAVLIATEHWLQRDHVSLISEFIDANEYGIALETLSVLLKEAGAEIDRGTYEDISSLAASMGLSAAVSERLSPKNPTATEDDFGR